MGQNPFHQLKLCLLLQQACHQNDASSKKRENPVNFLRLGCTGASAEVAYSTSKGGVNAFTKALAKELAPSNIQVNAIACGIIDTAMNSRLTKEELTAITDEIPAGRMGTVDEVAQLAYDINKKNDYLTGQIIILDGGWL